MKIGVAERMSGIRSFYVMDLLARARALERQGRSIIHMEVGEPDFVTPEPVTQAGIDALKAGKTHYTPAAGLPELRARLSIFYREQLAVEVPAEHILITPGASGALQLALGVTVNPGEGVMMADPGYPCNRHFVRMFGGEAQCVPVDNSSDYQLTAELIEQHWTQETKAVMIASPSNPTGTMVDPNEIAQINAFVKQQDGVLIIDEIYAMLSYEQQAYSLLATAPDAFIINSFSKYFGMTGWRLGWLIAPEAYVDAVERLAQNIFLAAPTMAQHAALSAFEPETMQILESRREAFKARRDYLMPALQQLGFEISTKPQGAFYLYADCSRFTDDSHAFVLDVLEKAGVAITPGCDFGDHRAKQHVRFAYTTSIDNLRQGVRRLGGYLSSL
ncbi:MAG: pyridoxal phosphate-dependent aminotransferase [Gammaproteobacteria bacterium]|nr:pyridoxal phosphate-dependent aminotransferase [Gammaproteobacteria bacterium]